MNLPEAKNANDRRNIAAGFVLRRIPETGFIYADVLEACAKRDFEPCGREESYHTSRLKDWYHYQNFYSLLSKLNTKGYIVLENDHKRLSNRKHIHAKTMVFRGRNYPHYAKGSNSLVEAYLKAYPIPILDELASL